MSVDVVLEAAAEVSRAGPPEGGDPELWQVAAEVAAPLLVGYVRHVLADARRRRLERLYFVSRDGEVLLDVARVLTAGRDGGPRLSYLHGGRLAWQPPAFGLRMDRDVHWVHEGQATPQVMAARLGVPVGAGPLDLLGDQELRARVLEARRDQRELAVRYLRQEGLLDGTSWAVVDVGWTGRQWAALVDLVASAGTAPGGCYLMGYLPHRPLASGDGWIAAWVADSRQDYAAAARLLRARTLVEVFCTGTGGGVAGYAEQGDVVAPVLRFPVNAAAIAWGLPTLRRAVLDVAQVVAQSPPVDDAEGAGAGEPLWQPLLQLYERPSRRQAQTLSSAPYEDAMDAVEGLPYAQPYRASELPRLVRRRHQGLWPAGSLALTPEPLRTAAATTVRLGDALSALAGRRKQVSRRR